MRKVLIVSNKTNRKYAEMIADKLTLLKDKYEATCMTDEQYCNGEKRLSLHNFIVFVGTTKTTKEVERFVNWTDRRCGIKYGFLGNRFFVYAENIDDETKFKDSYGELAKKHGGENLKIHNPKEFELYEGLDFSDPTNIAVGGLSTVVGAPIALVIKGIGLVDKTMSLKDKLRLLDIKYKIALEEFLNDFLLNSQFIEENNDTLNFYEKKIIIVTPKTPDAFAEMFASLVYGSNQLIDVVIMNEDQYLLQRPTIPNTQKVIFLNCKYAKKNIIINKYGFNKWGLSYGYAGNRVVISYNKASVTKQNKTEYEKFLREIKKSFDIKKQDYENELRALKLANASGATYSAGSLLKDAWESAQWYKLGIKPIVVAGKFASVSLLVVTVLFGEFVEKIVKDNVKNKEQKIGKFQKIVYLITRFFDNEFEKFMED